MPSLHHFILLLLASFSQAVSGRTVKRQASQLRESYDFVIAGGGTCGLTVADRLTEAFPDSEISSPHHE
jgi:hypothetical protein